MPYETLLSALRMADAGTIPITFLFTGRPDHHPYPCYRVAEWVIEIFNDAGSYDYVESVQRDGERKIEYADLPDSIRHFEPENWERWGW